jgi:hypothetical protein
MTGSFLEGESGFYTGRESDATKVDGEKGTEQHQHTGADRERPPLIVRVHNLRFLFSAVANG